MLTQKGARKVVRKAGNNEFKGYRQLCLMYGTSDQEGSTGLFVMRIQWKSMPSPEKGKAKKNEARARRVARKEKKASGKRYAETTTEHSRFEGECRNCGKYGHKCADCWYKQPPKLQGKGKGTGKSKVVADFGQSIFGHRVWPIAHFITVRKDITS